MNDISVERDGGRVMAMVEANLQEALRVRKASRVCVGCDVPFSEEGL